VRYLGIEMGLHSHKPAAPDKVIEQRYGDCKDKARLLVSLLQGMGLEAHCVLVNTDNGVRLTKALPTPTLFNHAIVRTQINARIYWRDPTRTHQSGSLEAL
jgi:transglutaminase-like putative cysteine protease